MAATVELRKGDMFEGPSDLVVLPCSTIPTITSFVRKRLRRFSIPEPQEPMRLGEVRFERLEDATQLAGWAAFAASVESGYSSTPEGIEEIGHALGRFAGENREVQTIAAPLLGTGAGRLGLEEATQALTKGFLASAPKGAVLRLHALQADDYAALERHFKEGESASGYEAAHDPDQEFVQPRVFLSYTATTDEHRSWVTDFGSWLRENGVNARLDTWHLHLGGDVAQWMCNELDQADRVLLICDERYAQKADGRHGGVGWEIRLVQGELLTHPDSHKFIAIVRTSEVDDGLPTFLRTAYALHWPDGAPESEVIQNRRRLLESLFQVEPRAREVGVPPLYIREALRRR